MTPDPHSNVAVPSSRWRAVCLLLVVFFLGAACGLGGGALALRAIVQRALHGEISAGNTPADWVISTLEHDIGNDLDLTEGERAAVHEELSTTAREFRAMRVKMLADTRDHVREALARIEKHLPEEKRARLREQVGRRLRPWGLIKGVER